MPHPPIEFSSPRDWMALSTRRRKPQASGSSEIFNTPRNSSLLRRSCIRSEASNLATTETTSSTKKNEEKQFVVNNRWSILSCDNAHTANKRWSAQKFASLRSHVPRKGGASSHQFRTWEARRKFLAVYGLAIRLATHQAVHKCDD